MKVTSINLWKWREDDEEETTAETDKLPELVVETEEPKETKEEKLERPDYEREDLITRFDRVVRGEFDLQVWINSTNVREEHVRKFSESNSTYISDIENYLNL